MDEEEERVSTTRNATPELLRAAELPELTALENAAKIGLKRAKDELKKATDDNVGLWRARRRLALRRVATIKQEMILRGVTMKVARGRGGKGRPKFSGRR